MKTIVILTGSPRKKGNTNTLVDAFAVEAGKLGCNVVKFDTTTMQIAPCKACEGCFKTGKCVQDDEFAKIAEAVEKADGFVIASPVYWYGFTAQIKLALDRSFSIYASGKLFDAKKCALISCCEESTESTFTGIKFSFERAMELMKGQIVGQVLVPGVNKVGDIANTNGIEQARELAHKFA